MSLFLARKANIFLLFFASKMINRYKNPLSSARITANNASQHEINKKFDAIT